ncbi:uncharacterized protein LOC124183163 [Neodiprion fabricii]|uniref:uncharacterized protein LOC124183163 n=1 Tax=Neodiprion fabricii TaxID=2872261 RepID=UPI001ED95046|nr:uncharacterized protein LOC124183163 [Neodiprion fabricii]XP_046427262.1 uncharacterized protein LOC124183163 [Neodiprion fabricii]
MFHGIFENIEEVQNILASHSLEPVDGNRIFELLEVYKTTEAVVKILMKSRSRPEPDLLMNPWAIKAGTSTQREDRSNRSGVFTCPSTEIDITHSSDDIEIIEHKIIRPVLLAKGSNEPEVLDLENCQINKDMPKVINREPEMLRCAEKVNYDHKRPKATKEIHENLKKKANCKVEKSAVENEAANQDAGEMEIEMADDLSTGLTKSVLDPTKDGLAETKTQREGAVDSSKDMFDSKGEEIDENNSESDSEVEMDDDYYRLVESDNFEEFDESRDIVSTPPNPILRLTDEAVFPNFQHQNTEASHFGQGENRIEEMLEENNNDPNNNLEDSEILDQNILTSVTKYDSVPLERDVIEEKSSSPKPGCSKDSYYTDFDARMAQVCEDKTDVNPTKTMSEKLTIKKRSQAYKERNLPAANNTPHNDATMIRDLNSIKTVLPGYSEKQIMSLLIKNIEASNRIELVLWDLLPAERPLPILCTKRKLKEDANPSSVKKFLQDEWTCNKEIKETTATSMEAPKTELIEPQRNGIVKPAKLKLLHASKNTVQPAKLPFANSSSHPQIPRPLMPKSGIILQPSKLNHLKRQAEDEQAKKPKTLIDEFENLTKSFFPHYVDLSTASVSSKNTGAISKKSTGTKSTVLEDQNDSLKRKVVTEMPAASTNSKTIKINHHRNDANFSDSSVKSRSRVRPKPEPDVIMFPPAHKMKSNDRQVNGVALPKVESRKTQLPQVAPPQGNLVVEMLQEVELSLKNTAILQKQVDLVTHTNHLTDEQRKPQVSLPARSPDVPSINPLPNSTLGAEQVEPAIRVRQGEKSDVQPPKELFNPLINIFPDVDPNHIADLCNEAKAKNQNLEYVVEILLVNGSRYPRIVNPDPEPQELNPDTQYENLQGIFPDAHPEYLRDIAERYYNDPEAMKNFVQANLEVPDYPTMADYQKKIKITEQIRQYTEDFCMEKFLEIFPDPFAHFEDSKRIYKYNVIAFEFLKSLFRLNKVTTIQRAYKSPKHPYHISLAAKELTIIGPDMKTKRGDKLIPTEDIPLLQEFAFIRHKIAIKEYMKKQKWQEKEEFKRLKANHELLECQCCFEAECMPSKCSTCSEGHIFCKSCIKLGSATKIGEGQTHFPCFMECKGEFTLPVLQKVLEPTMFSILLRKRQEEEVKAAGLEGLISCPFCHFASIPPPEDKVFKCLNPECMKETCRLCKEVNHVPLRCDEVTKGEEARHYLEEKMTEALVRKCYKCSRPFFKDEGCNKMTCPCGATTCYICGEPVKDYKHFNGQGSDRADLCPLWSDNKVLNAETVRVVAKAAEKEILKKNPHLKIDARTLMPMLPQASKGPHQDIANGHILPIHIRRT